MKILSLIAAACLVMTQSVAAQPVYPSDPAPEGLPEPKGALEPLMDYVPGMGTLYKDPEAPLAGPFAAYDTEGKLVSTIYMVSIDDLNAHTKIDQLQTHGDDVVSVELYYNPGHHGFPGPHYHIVLWHMDPSEAALD